MNNPEINMTPTPEQAVSEPYQPVDAAPVAPATEPTENLGVLSRLDALETKLDKVDNVLGNIINDLSQIVDNAGDFSIADRAIINHAKFVLEKYYSNDKPKQSD